MRHHNPYIIDLIRLEEWDTFDLSSETKTSGAGERKMYAQKEVIFLTQDSMMSIFVLK